MNLVIAAVLLTGRSGLFGVPAPRPRVVGVSRVRPARRRGGRRDDVPPSDQAPRPRRPGCCPATVIVPIDGRHDHARWHDAQQAIRGAGGRTSHRRGARRQRLTLRGRPADQRPVLDDQGTPSTAADGTVETTQAGFLGVSPAGGHERQPITAVPGASGERLHPDGRSSSAHPAEDRRVAQAAFGSGQRDPNGPICVVGVGRIAGEIASSNSPGRRPRASRLAHAQPARRRSTWRCSSSTSSRCCRSTAATSPGRCGRALQAPRRPGASAARPRPGRRRAACCRSPTAMAIVLVVHVGAADLRRHRQPGEARAADAARPGAVPPAVGAGRRYLSA